MTATASPAPRPTRVQVAIVAVRARVLLDELEARVQMARRLQARRPFTGARLARVTRDLLFHSEIDWEAQRVRSACEKALGTRDR